MAKARGTQRPTLIDSDIRTFVQESDKAKRLEDKAADSISHRARLERPDVIDRRIKRLEAELRKMQRQQKHWSNQDEYNRRVAILSQEIEENEARLEKAKQN